MIFIITLWGKIGYSGFKSSSSDPSSFFISPMTMQQASDTCTFLYSFHEKTKIELWYINFCCLYIPMLLKIYEYKLIIIHVYYWFKFCIAMKIGINLPWYVDGVLLSLWFSVHSALFGTFCSVFSFLYIVLCLVRFAQSLVFCT